MYVVVEKNPQGKHMIVAEWGSYSDAEIDVIEWSKANPSCSYRVEEAL